MRTLTMIACLLGICAPAFAHTPHHVIDALELSPDYENDSTVFVLVHNYLLRSTERGANWQQLVNGIDSPYVMSDVAVSGSFESDDVLFVSTDGDGVFRSADRGDSWQRFNIGLRQHDIGLLLVVDGNEAGPTILAAGSSRGLFASPLQDAGWRRLLSDDVQVTALAVVERNGTPYAMAGDANGGLWKSDQDLGNWQRVARLETAGAITSIAGISAPELAGTILVGTEQAGLLRMSDDGATPEFLSRSWPNKVEDCRGRALETARPDNHIRDIHWSDDSQQIFVTTWNKAVHVSRDAGQSWQTLGTGLECDDQADATGFLVPHFRDLEMGAAGDWFLASFDGLYRSEDNGESWAQLETMPVSLIRGLAISPASGRDHRLLVTTYGGGAYTSDDQGQSWTIENGGLVSTRLADAEFSPEFWTDGRVFGLAKERLLVGDAKRDGWHAESLVYSGWRRQIGVAANYLLDYSERSGVWPMQIELSPAFGTDQTMLVGFRRRGVWISEDGGTEWDRTWEGPTDYVTDLKVSPGFSNDGTAFAGFRGAGIYVTRDRAKSWQPANSGFEFFQDHQATKSPNHFIDPPLSRAISDVVLAVSPEFAADRILFAGSAAGLFRSGDGGDTWQQLILPLSPDNVSVVALAVSPDFGTDQTIFVSVKGKGLYQSIDGGQTFMQVGQDLRELNAELRFIRFSPTFDDDGIIYGANDWELYQSRDRGVTWEVIERPVRYEDWRGTYAGPVWFTGDWERATGADFSASTQTASDEPGAKARLKFVGPAIEWSGERGPSGGMARVIVDGAEAGTADLYAEKKSRGTSIFRLSGLTDKPHDVAIEVLSDKNPRSAGRRVTVDSIDVLRH